MDTAKLITLVYMRSPLWDQQDRQYTNRRFTDQLWEEIAQEMRSSKEMIKSKWKNLRDAYRKEFKKNQGENSTDPVISQWAHFKQMSFIKDQMFPSLGHNENSTQSTSSEYVECGDQDNEEMNYPQYHYLSENIDDNLFIQAKRKRVLNSETELSDAEQRKKYMLDSEYPKNITVCDEDKHFFLSLVPTIKNLPVIEKLSLRIKIQQLILVHIKQYENSAPSAPHGNEDIIRQEECLIKTEMIDIPEFLDNTEVFEEQQSMNDNMNDVQNDSETLPPEMNILPNISTNILPNISTNISSNITEQNSDVAKNEKDRDEYDIYGEYIGYKLRKFPNPRVRCIVQHLINNVIFRAEMGKFDNATVNTL